MRVAKKYQREGEKSEQERWKRKSMRVTKKQEKRYNNEEKCEKRAKHAKNRQIDSYDEILMAKRSFLLE